MSKLLVIIALYWVIGVTCIFIFLGLWSLIVWLIDYWRFR